jgi:hypothetical protein
MALETRVLILRFLRLNSLNQVAWELTNLLGTASATQWNRRCARFAPLRENVQQMSASVHDRSKKVA